MHWAWNVFCLVVLAGHSYAGNGIWDLLCIRNGMAGTLVKREDLHLFPNYVESKDYKYCQGLYYPDHGNTQTGNRCGGHLESAETAYCATNKQVCLCRLYDGPVKGPVNQVVQLANDYQADVYLCYNRQNSTATKSIQIVPIKYCNVKDADKNWQDTQTKCANMK